MANTICLSMIVKNESKIIRRMLDSVSSIIDCYCICDTGSTDDTVEVIEKYFKEKGIFGKVIVEPFKNFCHNRNVALEACKCMSEFVLLMDADMKLVVNNFNKSILQDIDQCYILQGSEQYHYPNTRIVRNDGKYKYHGVTHEYVGASYKARSMHLTKDQLFIHDIGDGGCKSNKFERDIELLSQGIIDEPENTRYYYYLGNSYHDAGRNEESIETYKKVIAMDGWVEEKYNACMNIYDCYCRLKQEELGIHYLILSHKFVSNRIEGIYKLIKYYSWNGLDTMSYALYTSIQHYFENEYYNETTGTLDDSISNHLFSSQVEYKFYLPYYMIIVSERVKKYEIGIRMYEIIFAGNYVDAGEWWNNNLMFNLQFFIDKINKENRSFFTKCETFIKNMEEKHTINHPELLERYRNICSTGEIEESIEPIRTPVINDKNVFLYWTGREYSLITLLRKLMYAHSNNETNYKIHLITKKNALQYVKELPSCFDSLLPAHQADLIRVHVICEYGGIWLDSDTLVMEDLQRLFTIFDGKDGFFMRQNNEVIWNGVFGSNANTQLLIEWKKYIDKTMSEKQQNIAWEEIGNTFLQKTFQETNLFNAYTIFEGLDTMYPVNYPDCVSEFIDKPIDNYIQLQREFQPIIVLVHSVYRKLENMSEDEIMCGNSPLQYFIRESFDNAKTLYKNKKSFGEEEVSLIRAPSGYKLHIENATFGKMDVTLQVRYLTMQQSNQKFTIDKWKYNDLICDPEYGVRKKFIVTYSFVKKTIPTPEKKIPKILVQCSRDGIPEYVVDMVKSQLTDEWKYIHFNDEEIIQYMRDHPSDEFPNIVEKFNSITRGPHKADLFRYYYLYTNGGVYLDSDAMMYQPIEKIVKNSSFFTVLGDIHFHIFNGIIGSTPGNSVIFEALKHAYEIELDSLNSNYQILCQALYNILCKSQEDNIILYKEFDNSNKMDARTEDHEGNIMFVHYPMTKIVPKPETDMMVSSCKRYIIVADWLLTSIFLEPYMFCKKLEELGWRMILQSELNVSHFKLNKTDKFVLCMTFDSFDIASIKTKNNTIGYMLNDVYPYKEMRNHCINNSDYLFGSFAYLFNEWKHTYANITNVPHFWNPYSAVNEFYEEIQFNKTPIQKIFVSGYVNDTYPLRKHMVKLAQTNDTIELLPHPNYEDEDRKHQYINDEYYKKLNQYLCCFNDALSWNYVNIRVFEIASVGALLLIQDSIKEQLNELGFYDNEHCIMCNESNVEEKMRWILDDNNRPQVDKIRKNGMVLTREKHTTQHRADRFNEHIQSIHL